jgi:flagellar assembly protein FliH
MTQTATTETARLVKARLLRAAGVQFSFDDLRRTPESADQAAALVPDPQAAQLEQARREAYEEGRLAGRREALEESQDWVARQAAERAQLLAETEVVQLKSAVRQALEQISEEQDRWLLSWETAAIQLAGAIAERIVHRELSQRPELNVQLVRQALQLATGQPGIKVHLHPQDAQAFGTGSSPVGANSTLPGKLEVVPDPSIAPGGCLIETDQGWIDARIDVQIQQILGELVDTP